MKKATAELGSVVALVIDVELLQLAFQKVFCDGGHHAVLVPFSIELVKDRVVIFVRLGRSQDLLQKGTLSGGAKKVSVYSIPYFFASFKAVNSAPPKPPLGKSEVGAQVE